jgi:hypothetical protein
VRSKKANLNNKFQNSDGSRVGWESSFFDSCDYLVVNVDVSRNEAEALGLAIYENWDQSYQFVLKQDYYSCFVFEETAEGI